MRRNSAAALQGPILGVRYIPAMYSSEEARVLPNGQIQWKIGARELELATQGYHLLATVADEDLAGFPLKIHRPDIGIIVDPVGYTQENWATPDYSLVGVYDNRAESHTIPPCTLMLVRQYLEAGGTNRGCAFLDYRYEQFMRLAEGSSTCTREYVLHTDPGAVNGFLYLAEKMEDHGMAQQGGELVEFILSHNPFAHLSLKHAVEHHPACIDAERYTPLLYLKGAHLSS
ncbi:hypothetical protein HZB01_02040 [Candidatus Woesearchaeota archaeon]|nr:hypothetical protein [Candidatus Woesearchaeota archaeon]